MNFIMGEKTGENLMKILGGWAIFLTFFVLYLLTIRLILVWFPQFSGYLILVNFALVSLGVVILAGVIFCWADDLDECRWVADIALILARPFVFYLGAVACCLYAFAFMVEAVLLLLDLDRDGQF
ncbi:hypothetical protein [Laspinema olomoucense]|uniref:hypothetical protein n=1 Tax=Laspinema olomoucense TaxID=3231600 RepID=UPI0021BA8042|nr:hypothetical protein [Laspinema sp. D3c]